MPQRNLNPSETDLPKFTEDGEQGWRRPTCSRMCRAQGLVVKRGTLGNDIRPSLCYFGGSMRL